MLASYREGSNCLTGITVNKSRQNLTSPLHVCSFFHCSAQASYFAAFRGIRDTKIEKSRGIQDKISL